MLPSSKSPDSITARKKTGPEGTNVEKNPLLLLERNPRGLYGEVVKGFL
jgi:hypothetical protein